MSKTTDAPKGQTGFYTLEEVGASLGVTRERARQIEKRALKKLEAKLKRQGLKLEDFLPDDVGAPTRNHFDKY